MVGLDGLEPSECHSQSVVPYHLATAQYKEKRLFMEVFFLVGWIVGFEPTIFSATN